MKPVSTHTVDAVWNDALSLHRAGQFDAAARLYDRILDVFPEHADALHMAGTLAQHRGDFALAMRQIGMALTLTPTSAVHVSMGMLQHACGQTDMAIANLHQALVLDPASAIAYNNLGTLLQAQGNFPAAMESYIQALDNKPDYASAYNNLGSAAHELGNVKEAAECYQQALALDPDYAMAYNNYGNALRNLGQPAQALPHFERALALDATALIHNNYGNALRDVARLDEAIAQFRQAIALEPAYAMAYNNLGNALRDRGEAQEAIGCFRQALEQAPELADVFSNMLLTMQTVPDLTPQQLFAEHKRYAQVYETPLLAQRLPHANDRDPERRLKIGFVSGDYREHALLYFFEPVLAGLDRSRFEVFCY
ncbi:MAG: tetratricopeptide repeat protein, partial [Janthinobacterium lividum]